MLIQVPKPPKSAFDPNRPVSSLLVAQMEYLHEAEKRLPSRYHSQIYINAVKTEGEAAKYIRHVTEAIHEAHLEAAFARMSPSLARFSPKNRSKRLLCWASALRIYRCSTPPIAPRSTWATSS